MAVLNSGELFEVDGFSFRGEHMNIATRTGRYSMPTRRGDNLILPGRSGSTFVASKPFDVGIGALAIWTIGATTVSGHLTIPATFILQRTQLEANVQAIMRLFTRPHRLSTIRAAQPDGSVRRALVEWKEWDEPTITAGGTRAEWAVAYEVPGTWWEDESTTTQAATSGSSLPKTLDLTSFTGMTGLIDDAVFTITGPITNPRVTDSETGAWIQYTGTVPSSQTWTFDCGAFTSARSDTGVVLGNTTHSGGYRFMVIPNTYNLTDTPRMVLSGTAGGTGTNMSITARRKWVNG